MQDSNRLISDIQKNSKDAERYLKDIFNKYEYFYKYSSRQYEEERLMTGSNNNDLRDFFVLVQTVKRNRDVIGSLIRGISNLRSLDNFKFVNQDLSENKKKIKSKKKEIIKDIEDIFNEESIKENSQEETRKNNMFDSLTDNKNDGVY